MASWCRIPGFAFRAFPRRRQRLPARQRRRKFACRKRRTSASGGGNPYVSEAPSKPAKVEQPPQGVEQKGYLSVVWTSHDDNDDDLTFSLYVRGDGEKNWRLLKDKIEQHYYSWDSTTMPDGGYYLKVVASDRPSNPTDQSLSAERESERFEVDNSQPAIQNLRAAADKSGYRRCGRYV